MEINITTAEEMQIIAGLQDRINKLKKLDFRHLGKGFDKEIETCEKVLEKIDQANYEEAQEIIRSEG